MAEALRERAEFVIRINETIGKIAEPAFNELNIHQLRVRRERFNAQFAALEAQHRLAINFVGTDEERGNLRKELYDLEDKVMDSRAVIDARIEDLDRQAALAAAAQGPQAQQPAQVVGQDGMPRFELTMPFQPQNIVNTWGKFDGNVLNWFDFKARFKIGVHDVDPAQLKPEYKIQYLRQALVGEAEDVAKGFSVVPANYEPLWEALVKKYEHRYSVACAFLSKFFAMPELKAPVSSSELHKMVTTTNEVLRRIVEIEYAVQNWDLLIVHALQERLPKELKNKWTSERGDDHTPTIDKMLDFLGKQATQIGSHDLSRAALQLKVSGERTKQGASGASYQPMSSRIDGATKYPCGVCKLNLHFTRDCPEFKPLTYDDRKKSAAINRLCFLCLKGGHFLNECFDMYRCNEKRCIDAGDTRHNSMLCPVKNRAEYVMTVSDHRGVAAKRSGEKSQS